MTLEEADHEPDPGTVGRITLGLVTEDQVDLKQGAAISVETPREWLGRSEDRLGGEGPGDLDHRNWGW